MSVAIEMIGEIAPDTKTVFDVGAKFGDHAVEIATLFPAAVVYAFEPVPANYVKLEGKRHPRIVPVNAAVLHSPGACEFNLYSHAGSHSIFIPDDEWDEAELVETMSVDAVSIDTFCEDVDISHIDILKVDVEGAELEVLRGAVGLLGQGRIDVVMVELMFYPYFKRQANPQGVIDFLRAHDMTMVAMFPTVYNGEVRYADAVFCLNRNDLHGDCLR